MLSGTIEELNETTFKNIGVMEKCSSYLNLESIQAFVLWYNIKKLHDVILFMV